VENTLRRDLFEDLAEYFEMNNREANRPAPEQ
jgi:hypothetical protein